MNREELIQLRDAIDMALALPDSVRELLVKWLAPEKPNGHDPHPPAASPPPRQAKRKPNAFAAKTAERKLIEAMRDNPSMSVVGLANAAGSSRSAAGERLRQMALRGSRISRTIGSSASERRIPGVPVALRLAPDAADHVLADCHQRGVGRGLCTGVKRRVEGSLKEDDKMSNDTPSEFDFENLMRSRGGPFWRDDSPRSRDRRSRAASWPTSKARESRRRTARTSR
jgi:hypothetical protein